MRFRPVVSVFLLAAYLPCCASYQATQQPLAEVVASPKPPERVRVQTLSGEAFTVWAPQVARDTLHGATGHPSGVTGQYAIPLSSIQSVKVYQPGSESDIIVGVLVGGLVIGLAYAIADFASCGIMCTD